MATAPSEAIMDAVEDTTDVINELSTEIENITKEAAFALVPELIDSVGFSYFKLGGVLSVIQENQWWQDDAESFREFIEEEFGMHYRKAMYLINIYDSLVEADIPWDKVSGLGWTKLRDMADILTNENVDEWVERANNLTSVNLQEAIKAFKSGTLSTDGTTDPDSSGISTITYQVHPDQKETIKQAIDLAMEEADTEFKSVALEAICMSYLAGGKPGKKKAKPLSLQGTMEKYEAMEVLDAFEAIWPDINITAEMEE